MVYEVRTEEVEVEVEVKVELKYKEKRKWTKSGENYTIYILIEY